MTIRQVIDLAKTSELANLSIGNKDEIVLGYINLGMIELYKRFNLRVEEWVITLEDNVDIYTTPSDFMWAIAAYGEVTDNKTDSVNELPINEEDNPLSINTVKWNKIQVPLSVTGAYVSIIYAASPVYYTMNDLELEIDLPIQMIDAMLAYIGYKANSTIDSGIQTEDSVWYSKFEASCARLEEKSMHNSNDMFMNKRLDTRGFV